MGLEIMKRFARYSKLLPLIALLGIAYFSFRSQEFEVNATTGRTYTSPAMPTKYADGFDFPVGGGTAAGYYTARRMVPYRHMGDDWNGNGGGNSDYGDPVLAIAHGKVVYSQNYGSDWGEVVIVRHKYRCNTGQTRYVDSLYGHVIRRLVGVGQEVRRGQRIASIGNNRGMYVAHLHLEIRKNTDIGIRAWAYPKSSANYHQPTSFIHANRPGRTAKPHQNHTFASNTAPGTGSTAAKSSTKSRESSEPLNNPLAGMMASVQSMAAATKSAATSSKPQSASRQESENKPLRLPGLGLNRSSTTLTARTSSAPKSSAPVTTANIRTTIRSGSAPNKPLLAVSGQKKEKNGFLGGLFKNKGRVEQTTVQNHRVSLSSGTRQTQVRASSSSPPRKGILKKIFKKKA